MVDLTCQQHLALFRFLAIGDVDRHAADADDIVGNVDACDRGSDAPAHLAVRAAYAKFALHGRRVRRGRLDRILHMLPVIWVDQRAKIVDRNLEILRVHAENPVLPVVPGEAAIDRIPLPGSHLAGGKR